VLLGLVGGVALAEKQSWQKEADQLSDRVEHVKGEIEAVINSPDAPPEWLELQKLNERISVIRGKQREEMQPLYERRRELSETKPVRQRQRKMRELYEELRRIRNKLETTLIDQGRRLHEKRRQELARVAAHAAPEARGMGFDVLTYPAEDGSTSTIPLSVIIACKFLGSEYEWKEGRRYGAPWDLSRSGMWRDAGVPYLVSARERPTATLSLVSYWPKAVARSGLLRDQRMAVIINRLLTTHSGTHGAYENVIRGRADVALIARRPSEDELELARKEGVELVAEEAARDAFVFMVHHENQVENLSTEQIRGIYSGDITNWKAVGGPDERIVPYQRDAQSGSQELMKSVVMKGRELTTSEWGTRRNLIAHGMGGPFIALTRDGQGIGFSVYYYEHFMAASPGTRLIGVDGVVPDYESISSGRYPFVTEVYVVTRKNLDRSHPAARWRQWLLSDEGQAVVRESGYVPAPR
jgi:phosphate transport system substrate-binding protein